MQPGSGFLLNSGGQSGRLSTVPGQTSGDVSGGTYSFTAPPSGGTILGQPNFINLTLSGTVGYDCAPNEACPDPGKTGSASIHATAHWLGMSVRDQAGNPIAFSVCSTTRTNWAQAQ